MDPLLLFSSQFNSLIWALTTILSFFLIKFSMVFFPVFPCSPPQITDVLLTLFIPTSSLAMAINYWHLLQPTKQLATRVVYTPLCCFQTLKYMLLKWGFFWHNLQILNNYDYSLGKICSYEEKEVTHDGPCWRIWKGYLRHSCAGPGDVFPWSLWISYGYSLDITQDILGFCDSKLVADGRIPSPNIK